MSEQRRKRRSLGKTKEGLIGLIGDFYDFLRKDPQPTNEEVLAKFKEMDSSWVKKCEKEGLTEESKLAFKREIATTWKKKIDQANQSNLQTKSENNSLTN